MNFSKVSNSVKELSIKARKDYSLVRSINNYHLMQGDKFIVIDESLEIIYIVVTAFLRDKRRAKKVQKV